MAEEGRAAEGDRMDSKTLAYLKANKAPADVISAAEAELMTQAAYTQARQRDGMTLQQALAALGAGAGSRGGAPAAPAKERKVEAFYKSISGENADTVRSLFQKFEEAIRTDILDESEDRMAPVRASAEEVKWSKRLDEYYEQKVAPRFGAKSAEKWPEIRQAALEQLMSDPNARVAPMEMYLEYFPEHAAEALATQFNEQKTTKAGGVTAGHEQTYSRVPSTTAAGQMPAAGGAKDGEELGEPDPSRIADDVLREMGIPH